MKTIHFPSDKSAQALDWLANRGGIAVWSNKDLSSHKLGSQQFTPALDVAKLNSTPAPHWSCGANPDFIVTDAACVMLEKWREIARIKARPYKYGRDPVNKQDRPKLDKALAAAGPDASWRFDWATGEYGSAWREVIIESPDAPICLASLQLQTT